MKATIIVVAIAAVLSGGMLSALAHNVPAKKRVVMPAQTRVVVPAKKRVVVPYRHHHHHYVAQPVVSCFLIFCVPRASAYHHH